MEIRIRFLAGSKGAAVQPATSMTATRPASQRHRCMQSVPCLREAQAFHVDEILERIPREHRKDVLFALGVLVEAIDDLKGTNP